MHKMLIGLFMLFLSVLACTQSRPEYVVVTATPNSDASLILPEQIINEPVATEIALNQPLIEPTLDPTRIQVAQAPGQEYVVQPDDTLSGIASGQGVTLQALLDANALLNPNILNVGQIIQLPDPPSETSSAFKILPDSRLVRAPGSRDFDVAQFIAQQPGFIRTASDEVDEQIYTATEIVQRVSLEYSVDARLLLALLEYKGRWLSQVNISEEAKTYALGGKASPLGFDRDGLYRQLTWTADQLNRGYYGWKYGNINVVEFEDGERVSFAQGINAATVGVQHFLSLNNRYGVWQSQIERDGFYQTYVAYFGDPFVNTVDPIVPNTIQQPTLTLPFASGETWFFTGGAHGGWGAGSAWSAIDFAPPDDLTLVTSACYVSDYWATAVAPGVVARTDEGTVILDLDGDGDESTGWSILYLHMAAQGRVAQGTVVSVGDRIGHPSCEGGFSNGTHMHIARRYNGEWLPADCSSCPDDGPQSSFVVGGWQVEALEGQEYQGYLAKDGERRIAEQGRLTTENNISW